MFIGLQHEFLSSLSTTHSLHNDETRLFPEAIRETLMIPVINLGLIVLLNV